MSISDKLRRVINVRADKPDFSPLGERNLEVQKILIGESPTDSDAKAISVPKLPCVETEFKNLTHLYLWSTTDLETLPSLSARQTVLEVRSSNASDFDRHITMSHCKRWC